MKTLCCGCSSEPFQRFVWAPKTGETCPQKGIKSLKKYTIYLANFDLCYALGRNNQISTKPHCGYLEVPSWEDGYCKNPGHVSTYIVGAQVSRLFEAVCMGIQER